jgi:hypothetical protein
LAQSNGKLGKQSEAAVTSVSELQSQWLVKAFRGGSQD